MAQYNRPPKKKVKGPDEFISFFDHLVKYFMIHRNKLFIVIGVAVLAFAGYGIFLYVQSNRVKEFAALYGEAMNAPEAQSLKKWQEIEQKSPPLELDDIISIQIGGVLGKEGKWDEAAAKFNRAALSQSEVLHYVSLWAGAVAQENSGKFPEAFKDYQNISQDEQNPYKEFGRLGMARILGLQGKTGEAETILMDLIKPESETPPAVQTAAKNNLIVLKMNPPVDQDPK